MSVHTRSQKLAEAAFTQVRRRFEKKENLKEYASFVKKFPSLIHTCGLAQAVAFAMAKGEKEYLDNLAAALTESGHTKIANADSLGEESRKTQLSEYMRLSRDALAAAGWLKRYVEALAPDNMPSADGQENAR